jgi:hypothetical protein
MTEFDASAAAARAVGNLAEGDLDAPTSATDADVAEAAAEVKGSSPSNQSEELTPMDVLMHTKPDLSVDDVRERVGVGQAGANALIGGRKVVHAVTGAGGGSDGGTPAIMNFASAGYHFFSGSGSSTSPPASEEDEPPETTESDGEAPSIGGVTAV